jgi:hypothetical protein
MTKPATPWTAHLLQVSLFSSAVFPLSDDYFSVLMGVEPDTNEDRPKEGVRRQTGLVDDVFVQVGVSPLRLDVTFSPPPQTATVDIDAIRVALGPFVPELHKFSDVVLKWIDKVSTPIVRMSFVGAAVVETVSREDAYAVLADSVKSLAISPKMEDLIYRVNWKLASNTVSEGFLNRLVTWTSFRLNIAAGFDPKGAVHVANRDFARLDLDINTPADRRDALPRTELSKMLSELFELAIDVVERGEPT